MFSIFGREGYSEKKGRETENLLDVLSHAGVHVLWRDNNSSSKGVADRVPYQDFQSSNSNPVCDEECRDEGMLTGLQDYIDNTGRGDILIVLHQMGNHGPAYYKRYPKEFEKFTPVCKSNQLEECTEEQIENAYANSVLYTDYFLSRVIELLKKNSKAYETAMVYMSDHGESLGENGLHLHGMPYFIAPDPQKHVAALMWFGDKFKIDREALRSKAQVPFSHDNLFHTVLGLMEVHTSIYDKRLDILNQDG
jgi:lipid A ethanolaminephosphotransferase